MSFISHSPKENQVHYLFIDGAYLRGVLDTYSKKLYSEMKLAVDYSRLAGGCTKVFYYDCPPPRSVQDTDQTYAQRLAEQEALYRRLKALRGWHIYEGVTKRTGKRAKQKEVDILIAVDMLSHSHRKNMSKASFIAGDQDFRPLVDALVREGMFIELIYDPTSASGELADAADARQEISPYLLESWLADDFRQAYPLPLRSGSTETLPPSARLLKSAHRGDCWVKLYEFGAEFLLVHPDQQNPKMLYRMTHHDQALLLRVHEIMHGPTNWSPSEA